MNSADSSRPAPGNWIVVVAAWAAVGIPLAWGVFQTILKASVLFR